MWVSERAAGADEGSRTKRITDAARPFATAISPIVFGRADKLSGIMPASQSINYEREIGCETGTLSRAYIVVCMLNACARLRAGFWKIGSRSHQHARGLFH